LAGFTKGEADKLRKAMGKKDSKTLDELKPKFMSNRRHCQRFDAKNWRKSGPTGKPLPPMPSTSRTLPVMPGLPIQTAYLKAHYPAEYMAANLTNNMNSMDTQVTFFMEECKRMGIPVLGPDVNESKSGFTVNAAGEIRFGMAAIKGQERLR
jgi:DNA polymerase III subunit alpha